MNIFKTVRQPFFAPDDNGQGDPNLEGGKITFTPEQQAEVDRIIGQRLTSERASKADYADLKEIGELVTQFGYTGSTADIKAQLKTQAEERRKATELEELKAEAEETGMSPALIAEMKQLKADMAKIQEKEQQQQQAMENKQKADEAWNEQAQIFQDKYPDVNMPKLAENERFMKFLRNSTLPFVDAYEEYLDLVGGAEKAAIEKIKANDDRSTFSGKAKADPSGGTHGLTDSQQELAKRNGMTFKEYADLYQQIPNK